MSTFHICHNEALTELFSEGKDRQFSALNIYKTPELLNAKARTFADDNICDEFQSFHGDVGSGCDGADSHCCEYISGPTGLCQKQTDSDSACQREPLFR